MKMWIAAAALLIMSAPGQAQTARKPCEDLKAEIAQKLDAKNVVSYTLDVVDKGKEGDGAKIVGSCDGGTKSIVYSRSSASTAKAAPAAPAQTAQSSKPQ